MVDRNNPDFLSASTIKKDRVVNGAGENLGKIEELMIDLQDGKVAYAVVSHGGFLGIGNNYFLFPGRLLHRSCMSTPFYSIFLKKPLKRQKALTKTSGL